MAEQAEAQEQTQDPAPETNPEATTEQTQEQSQEQSQEQQTPPDEQRSWFGSDDAPNDADETKVADDGLGPSQKQMPDWVPAEYHDPSRRAELLEELGFTKEEVQEQQAENERPEWLPEKFDSPEDMAKSYKELEQRLGGKSQVPEQYELELPEGVDELPEEDAEAFKEAGLSNESAQQMLNYFQDNIVPQMKEQRTQRETQQLASAWGMVSDGGKPDQEALASRMAAVKQWANSNVPEGVVKELSTSASGVQQLYNLMQSKGGGRQSPTSSSKPDPARLQQLVNDDRYWNDPAFRDQVNKQFKDAYD